MSGDYDPSLRWTGSSGTNSSPTSALNVKPVPSHKSHNHRHIYHGKPNSKYSTQLDHYQLGPLEFRGHGCFVDIEQSVCGYRSCAARSGYDRFVQYSCGSIIGMGAVRDIESCCCILLSMTRVQVGSGTCVYIADSEGMARDCCWI
jgi:hypothetical protein